MSVPGLQHHTFLSFTQTTSNQNLVMTRSTSRKVEGLVKFDSQNRSHIVRSRSGQNKQLHGSTSVALGEGQRDCVTLKMCGSTETAQMVSERTGGTPDYETKCFTASYQSWLANLN